MTTCVLVRKGNEAVLATDGQVTMGTTILDDQTTKVVDCDVNGQAYVATAGSYAAITWVRTYLSRWADLVAQVRAGFHVPQLALEVKKFDNDAVGLIINFPDEYKGFIDSLTDIDPESPGKIEFEHLLLSKRGAYELSGDYSILPIKRFSAIGSGASKALSFLGSKYDSKLSISDLAERSIKEAIKTDIGSSGKISMYHISGIDEAEADGFLKIRVDEADVDFYRARAEEEDEQEGGGN